MPDTTFRRANDELDRMGNALIQGATFAPRLTMDIIIALRSVLTRHSPYPQARYTILCTHCGMPWACPDAAAVLKALALSDDEEDDRD